MFAALIVKYVISTLLGSGFGSNPGQQAASMVVQQIVLIFISAVTIVVVAVPEGLPLAVTLALVIIHCTHFSLRSLHPSLITLTIILFNYTHYTH